jgi:hypothetical protein
VQCGAPLDLCAQGRTFRSTTFFKTKELVF